MDLSGYHPVQIVVGLRKNKSNHQFHSGLEHTFLWVVDADNAHLIEDLMGRTAGRFNTIKIVPLVTFQGVIERCKQIEEGTFFSDAAGYVV
jgi:hypothetical protein